MSSSLWSTSADLVARYRALQNLNVSGSDTYVPATPPATVVKRLQLFSLAWKDLTTLQKQAVLWDMGFVASGKGTVVQIYTNCASNNQGLPMAMIALTKAEVVGLSNTTINCISPYMTSSYARLNSSSLSTLTSKCAIPYASYANSTASVWAQDGLQLSSALDTRIFQHPVDDDVPILNIHVFRSGGSDGSTIGVDTCPTAPDGLTIPCATYVASSSSSSSPQWCVPTSSDAMTSWLIETQASKVTTAPPVTITTSSSNTATVVVLAVLLGFMILIAAGLLWLKCRRKAKGFLARSDAGQGFLREALFRRRNQPPVEVAADDSYERDMQAVTIGPAAKSLKIEAFEHDPFLYTKRLSFGAIVVTRLISKGAYGEVWLGRYRHKEVAIKKILHAKRNDTFELECFTEEIRIMASLDHPHIVHLIGFGWDTITNLCAVTEYLAKGDLTGYLVANQDLSWDAKLRIAVGTARALAYMHERDPPVIHRDLKSKNILITDTGEAKLSDFGISRVRTLDETLTAGVGTVYWTAPEVLLGQRYTEQVDIYSFGVVLCELDTHRAPYADMQEVAQMAIAQQVATHQFRPPFSAKCPKLVKDLADRCMDQDPSARPTAQEIVDLIELWKGWKK